MDKQIDGKGNQVNVANNNTQKEANFNQYLKQLEDELKSKATSAKTDLQKTIDQFYADNHYDDAKDLIRGESYDFVQQSEFSLANLKSAIDAITKAVFAGTETPPGVTINRDVVETVTKAIGLTSTPVANLELHVSAKAFDLLSEAILSFGQTTALSLTTATESEPLGYGLQLFVVVAADSFRSESSLNDGEINGYLYYYVVKFSEKQAQAEIYQALIERYQKQITTCTDKLNQLLNQLEQGTLTPEAYQSQSDAYQKLIAQAQAKIQKL
jgi:hypothetical protein